jgi:ribonuclease R
VGDVLAGAITGVTSFGVFVVMDEPFVEGLVRTDYLVPDDFYEYDTVACRLVGRRHGRTFSLGDRIEVEILQVSVARRRIELRVRDGQGGQRRRGRHGRHAKPKRRGR